MQPSPMRKRLDRYVKLLDSGGDERVLDALDALVRILVQARRRLPRDTASVRLVRASPRRRHPPHHRQST